MAGVSTEPLPLAAQMTLSGEAAPPQESALISRRRREIEKIIQEEQDRIVQVAVSHHDVSSKRVIMRRWIHEVHGKGRLRRIAKQGAQALLHRSLRKGLNGWLAFILERVAALTQLHAAAQGFRMRGQKKVMNLLVEIHQARQRKLAALRQAASSWVFAALKRGWRKLVVLGAQRAKVKRAARSLLFRNRRKGWNGWMAMMLEKARKLLAMQRAAAVFQNRGLKKGWNGWLAMRAERHMAMQRMKAAALNFTQRAVRRGFRAWFPLAAERQSFKRAGQAFAFRHRRKGFNGWVSMIRRRANLIYQMRATAMAFSQGAYKACWNTWKEQVQGHAEALVKLRAAVNVMMGGKVRAAFNSLANRSIASAAKFGAFERAGAKWAQGAMGVGFRAWVLYAAAQRDLPEGGVPRPISPKAKKRIKWAKRMEAVIETREITADDKYVCQRSLLSPFAALVLRYDGAVLRVVAIHRPATEALCTVDMVRGYDELLLQEQISPEARVTDDLLPTRPALSKGGGGFSRVSAGSLSPPIHPLIIPGFFGGVLHLKNDLDVRVIDAKFEASQAPPDPDDDPSAMPEKVLSQVLLTLVDGQGEAVGRPCWTSLVDLLELLPAGAVFQAESASEDTLRRKRRLELHRGEQRRLALHHLRLASRRGEVPTAWGEGGGNVAAGASALELDAGGGGGIDALHRQLLEAAPSKLLVEALGENATGNRPPANRPRGMGDGTGLAGYGFGGADRARAEANAAYAAAYGAGVQSVEGIGGTDMSLFKRPGGGKGMGSAAQPFAVGYNEAPRRPASANFYR